MCVCVYTIYAFQQSIYITISQYKLLRITVELRIIRNIRKAYNMVPMLQTFSKYIQ